MKTSMKLIAALLLIFSMTARAADTEKDAKPIQDSSAALPHDPYFDKMANMQKELDLLRKTQDIETTRKAIETASGTVRADRGMKMVEVPLVVSIFGRNGVRSARIVTSKGIEKNIVEGDVLGANLVVQSITPKAVIVRYGQSYIRALEFKSGVTLISGNGASGQLNGLPDLPNGEIPGLMAVPTTATMPTLPH